MAKQWIKFPNGVLSNDALKDLAAYRVYGYLVQHLSGFTRKTPNGKKLSPGQLYYSIRHIEEETGLTTKQIRRALRILEEGGLLIQETSSSGTIGTLPQIMEVYKTPTHTEQPKNTEQPKTKEPPEKKEEQHEMIWDRIEPPPVADFLKMS